MRRLTTIALALLVLAPVSSAQLLNREARVRVSHYHLNVTSVADHSRFWVDTLGGTAMKVGEVDAVRFGDVLVLLHVQPPTGPTRGTTFDHIGLSTPSVPELTARVVAAGYRLTVGREIPGQAPRETPAGGTSAVYGRFEYLVGPDGVKVELVTNTEPNAPPIAHHHVHFVNPQYVEMRDWYVTALDATERTGPNTFTDFFAGADLPNIGYMLNFFRWELDEPLVGTAGRAVDRVGFEVRDLEAFVRGLDAKGIRLTSPLRQDPRRGGVRTATITDPWGTVIELTEGMDRVF
jgi:catechol 2,3-dioxygenase-like lactoylglutathione lyase family enzyme